MSPTAQEQKIIIIGAGPIGLETALYARTLGYTVRVLERKGIGGNMNRWKHVRLFSPFGMNHTPLGKRLLAARGIDLPDNDRLLTGDEYLRIYLQPLSEDPLLSGCIETGVDVLAIGRRHIFKNEHIGDGERPNYAFRVLASHRRGQERVYMADYVVDASGTYGNHNWIGDGGIPAVGERKNGELITYMLDDIEGETRNRYLGKTTLLIGAGHSAATSAAAFEGLFEENNSTRLVWLTRSGRERPVLEIENDPLAERKRIVEKANRIPGHPNAQWVPGAVVNSINFDEKTRRFILEFGMADRTRQVFVDNVIANVGYSPDNSIYRELQVHECFASCGPMKLAAALLGESGADCLDRPSLGAEVLRNPEPNFYILGAKSYGKNSNFLMRMGFEQVRDAFQLISRDPSLDLYAPSTADVTAAG